MCMCVRVMDRGEGGAREKEIGIDRKKNRKRERGERVRSVCICSLNGTPQSFHEDKAKFKQHTQTKDIISSEYGGLGINIQKFKFSTKKGGGGSVCKEQL